MTSAAELRARMTQQIKRHGLQQCVMCHRTGTVSGDDPCELCGGYGIIGVSAALDLLEAAEELTEKARGVITVGQRVERGLLAERDAAIQRAEAAEERAQKLYEQHLSCGDAYAEISAEVERLRARIGTREDAHQVRADAGIVQAADDLSIKMLSVRVNQLTEALRHIAGLNGGTMNIQWAQLKAQNALDSDTTEKT